MLLTIQDAYDSVPLGNYTTTFRSMVPKETSKGKAYLWTFEVVEGEKTGSEISDFSDANSGPTTKNKTGRWLAAIAKKPLEKDVSVNPDKHVGKRYLVIVEPGTNGKNKIATFTLLA